MKNYMRYISLFLMIIGMSIGSLNTASATTAAGTYTLQKGAQNSTSLDPGQYVMVIKSTNLYAVPAFAGSGARNIQCSDYQIDSYVTGSYYQRDEVCTLNLDGTEGITEWTITENLGSYKFFDGTYYICGQSSNSNKLLASTSSATAAEWSITHTGSLTYTAATVRNEDDVTYEYCRGNGTILSGYTSSGQGIYFFKKTATLYDINKEPDASGTASMDAQVGGVSVTKAAEDATVVLSQTANPNYRFDGWNVIDEDSHVITVTNNQFTMPAADVWVYPQYTACGTDATVTAASSESVSQTTATIRCASGISSKGDSWCAIIEYGFVISAKSTNSNPAIGGSGVTKHQIGTSYTTLSTAFSKALTGLTASTTYCVRAYAINGHGTAYSSAVHEFTTTAETQYGNYVITCDDYHTVTYNANTEDPYTGSLPTDANTYAAGQTVYMSDGTLSRTGYEFVGWNTNSAATTAITEFVMGSSNTIVYAIWSPIDYTLTMATSVGGGAGTTVSDATITSPRMGAGTVADKHYREEITVTVVTPAHHTFTGWTSSNGGSFVNASATTTTFTMPAGNTTVTANFTEDTKYTVTWSDNGETNTEQVYSGETTTFPSLMSDCDMYVATGWVQDNSNTFVSETLTKPGTIYAAGATTPTISAAITYKAVYRHKYYTDADFVSGTTDGKGYYLYAEYSSDKHYKTTYSSNAFNTSTTKASAVPVYLIKTGDYYYIQDVNTGDYYYSYTYKDNKDKDQFDLRSNDSNGETDVYKWSIATSACGTPGMGDYKITNKAHAENTTLRLNSSGDYIKQYKQTGDCPTSGYYDLYLEKAYYYKYSPDAACYDITVSTNGWARATWETVDGSHKLQGTQLTVTPACGYHITSVSITNGTFTPASGYETHDPVTFTIVPTGNCTFTVNFNSTPSDDDKYTISFLDGATTLLQSKTDPQYECGSYSLPNGYSTSEGAGGACDGWTFDGWTATDYIYGQMSAPSDIQVAGSSQTASGDATWYAVYHKTYAAGDYFNLLYGGTKYISSYGSNQFSISTNSADALMFGMEDGYLYYIDKETRAKKWVYYAGPSGQNVTVSDAKPSSNSYKTTFTLNSGTYEIVSNGKWLEINNSDKVKFYATTTAANRATKPNASSFTAYYPKTDCTIENVTITLDAGAGNIFTSNSSQTYAIVAESGSTIALPIGNDLTYDNTSWTFAGWTATTIGNISAGAPSDLIAGGGSYTATEDATLHAVYTQTPPQYTFDNSQGGTYVIWAEVSGINYYVKSTGAQTKGNLGYTEACSQASIFELVETENAGEYKIHVVGEAKYLGGEGCGDSQTDFVYVNADAAPVWTITAGTINGDWRVASTCGNRAFICQHSGSTVFGHYSAGNVSASPSLYYDVYIGHCDNYYTTNPNKTLAATGDVKVTSSNGRMIMAKDPMVINATNLTPEGVITITSNSSDVYFSTTREVNISKASRPTTSVSFTANGSGNVTNQNIYVHYMPTVSKEGAENVTVTIASADKTIEKTIQVRHMSASFVIAGKVGGSWYALPANTETEGTPAVVLIDVDESTMTAKAPATCAYTLWPVKTTSGSGDRYALQGGNAYGECVRFAAVSDNKALWANNVSSGGGSAQIKNLNAITQISDAGEAPAANEWKISTTITAGKWHYTLESNQTNQAGRQLWIYRGNEVVWGTYVNGLTSDLYFLPITEVLPFSMKVVEWYPTKVLIYTKSDLSTYAPSVSVGGVAVESPSCTAKGTNLYEIGNLSLEENPTQTLTISYTVSTTTYSCMETIPIIISRVTKSIVDASSAEVAGEKSLNEPFASLTKDVYNYSNLVVRDGAVLTLNGTKNQNKFFDVTIYPTSKISVPAENATGNTAQLGVHSLTFFGGIDEIYNGSSYTINKYGVPELSLKGICGSKTVTTINYDMRVDANQMYSLTVPYDVNLADITYWDGTSMGTLGDSLWVSAYDGQARANKQMNNTWIWEADFVSKGLEAKLKAGVGYTISAELQKGFGDGTGGEYSIIRMPMKSNFNGSGTNTEVAKSVAVIAYDNNQGHTISANHKGWNLVGNPYMVSINGGDADSKLVVGYLIPDPSKDPWDGTYVWKNDDCRYVTIPFDDGTDYYQQKYSDATLKPFKNFFIQVATSGDLSFALASRQNAPARFLQVAEREVEFEILLANESRKDNMGLLIADQYSTDYEINADLEKMIGTMSVYSILGGYNLAYNALSPDNAKEWIPVGYVAPTAGEYTFSLDENSDMTEVEHVYLTDYLLTKTVDLVEKSYTFSTETGKNEARFAINVVLKPEDIDPIETGVNHLDSDSDVPTKFIYQDKMYILYQGVIYDATGKRVKVINK